jgi:cell division transport system permease protein
VYEIRNIAAAVGLVLGAAFAIVAIIIIASTIRMTVMARAEEIAIMKLVGATDGYIRRPFLLDGLLKGLLGGALALLLTWAANELVSRYVLRTEFFDGRVVLLGLLGGALLGTIGSVLSVGRHLRQV